MWHVREIGRRRLLTLGLGGLAMLALGFVIAAAGKGGLGSESGPADRMAFYYADATSEQLPLTAGEATSAGWEGSTRCILGKGRFYQKSVGGEPYPLLLMYNREDRLIGIRMFSRIKQPTPPWEHEPEGLPETNVVNMEFEQWNTGIYLIDPSRACGASLGVTGL